MDKGLRYRFFVHREQTAYRLVLRDDGSFPEAPPNRIGGLTRVRDEHEVNADVRDEIAASGYCPFAIGLKLDALKR